MNPTENYLPAPEHASDEDNPLLLEALREYQAALDAGLRPNKRELLARYSEVADELSDCLAGLDLMHTGSPRLQAPESALSSEGTLGDFRLLREIGRGGMGVVYEAVQLSLGRRVALKVLPLAATFDGRQLQRFENEARAAAHLHHGNIVPVFAVGCERGVPYYAMQLIDGQSLAAVIDDLRKRPAPAAPAADTVAGAASLTERSVGSQAFFRAVATAGVQAANALEHAHQMGIVHRDVKPANLLLDTRGHLWVTDFGLARFQESPGLTATGDVVGTLRYMSPEQASGQPVIDPRSDIYGLGVTLYELLTQQPAFAGRDRQACLRQVLEEEPTPPRRLNKTVPAELETIVLKAMAKAPEDRYGSAGELAEDLERFLSDKPIRARPPALRERAARWARRHHRLVLALVLGLMLAVVVLGATTWRIAWAEARTQKAYAALKHEQELRETAYRELEKEQGRTTLAWEEEAAQRALAEDNYRQAREVLDFLNRLGVEEMANKPELQALRQRLLAKLLDYYQAFIDRQGPATPVADELLAAQLQVAGLLDEIGRKADALAAFEKAMRGRSLPPGGPPHRHCGPCRPPRGIASLFLLGQPAVQADLKLSEEQTKKVRALLDFRGRPPSNEEVAAAEKGLAKALRSNQSKRLEQIIRQMRGPQGLLDPETATALRLTKRQKEQIQTVLARGERRPEQGRPRGQGPRGRGPGGPPIGPKQIEEQALAVLSAEQRGSWRVLLGKPFRGDLQGGPRPDRPKALGATRFAYYEGKWEKLPNFAKMAPVAVGTGTAFDLGPARRKEHYAMRFEGFFRTAGAGEHTFTLSSDDGARLYIDGKQVVDNDGDHPLRTRQGKVRLAEGAHRVVVAYFQGRGPTDLAIEVQGPGLGRRNLGDLVVPTEKDLGRPPEAP